MKEINIVTGAGPETFRNLSMDVAIREGFNCYSKPILYKDTDNKFYFSWKGEKLQVTIEHKAGAPIYKVAGIEQQPEFVELEKKEPRKNFMVNEADQLAKILQWLNSQNVPVSHKPVGSKYKIMIKGTNKDIEKNIRLLIQN